MRQRSRHIALLSGTLSALLWSSCDCGSRAVGESCESSDDCQSDGVCIVGVCRRACNIGDNCEEDEDCVQGTCMPALDSGIPDRTDAALTDQLQSDTTRRDLPNPDVTPRDSAPPDLRPTDTPPQDSPLQDLRPLDSRPLDSRPLDSRLPDTTPVDHATPDLRAPDTTPVDRAQPDTVCVPDCGVRECGPDGCDGTCGECDDPLECSPSGFCECNNSLCGGTCCEEGESCVGDHCCATTAWRTTFNGVYLLDGFIDGDDNIFVVGNRGDSAYVARLDACGQLKDDRTFTPAWATVASAGRVIRSEDLLFVAGPGVNISNDYAGVMDPPDGMLAVLDANTLEDIDPPHQFNDMGEERILDLEVDGDDMIWMAGVSGIIPGAVGNRLAMLALADAGHPPHVHRPWGTVDDRAYARLLNYDPGADRMHLLGDWHENGGVHHEYVSYYNAADIEEPDSALPDPTWTSTIMPDSAVSFVGTDSLLRGSTIIVAALEYAPDYPDGRVTAASITVPNGTVLHAPEKYNPSDQHDCPFGIALIPYSDMLFSVGVIDWNESDDVDQFANSRAFMVRYDADTLEQDFVETYSRYISFQAVRVDAGLGLVVVALGGGFDRRSSTVMRCDTDGVCP